MKELIRFHIDEMKGSYIFKIEPPSAAQIIRFPRPDKIDERQKVVKQVMKIRNKILEKENLTGLKEELYRDLLKIGDSIQELMGYNCLTDLIGLLTKYHTLLILTNDPIIPWELLSVGNSLACLNNSIGRVISGGKISEDFKKVEKDVVQLLFIADPLGDLAAAREEVENIIKQLKPAIDQGYIKTTTIMGSNASVTNIMELLKNNRFDIIHFSGHAFFNEKSPEESGLHLADKIVSAKEISKSLKYFPDIVFINACESAHAEISEIEGQQVSGLAEAFIEAGTKTFVGSVWPINNKDATNFAVSFYQNLLQEKKTIGECILDSKNELYHSESIYGWASFLLFGDPNATPFLFDENLKNNVERSIILPLEQPFQLRALKDEFLLISIEIESELRNKIIPFGIEDLIIKKIEDEEFNIILGPTGMGKTNCKYLLAQNEKDIKFVEINKRLLKGIGNSEFLLKIQAELKSLAEKHRLVVLVLDEEHSASDMTGVNLIEIVQILFESGQPTKMKENVRVLLFLRTKSYKNIFRAEKIPSHWKVQKTWLEGINLTENSIEKFLSIHSLSKDSFTKPAYEKLINRISSRGWIYPIIADNFLLYLEKNLKEKFTTEDIENIRVSDDVRDTIRNLVFRIRTIEEQNVWNCIVNLNKTFKLNPPLWLIKTTLKYILNIDIPALNEILLELQKDKLLIEQKDEILVGVDGVLGDKDSNTYLLAHEIYYEVTPQKEYDGDVKLELIELIEDELNNHLEKAQKTKNLKILRIVLKNVLQRFYFLSATKFIDNTEYIDKVLNYLNNVDLNIQKTIIPDLERLVLDFYARNNVESIAKLYLFIGDYYEKTNDLHNATDYYNIGCHLLEYQNMDSTQYRVRNGNLYYKMMNDLKNEIDKFEIQCTIELASWQWKASKKYEKGIEVRKILVDAFLKDNKPWAAAEIKWLAEVSELNNKLDDAIQYYNKAIKLLETMPHHIFNIKDFLKQISLILEKLNKMDEKQNINSRTNEIDKKIQSMIKPNGIKIHIISERGDLFPANQIQYKILQEISSICTIEAAAPTEKVDILITFGTPLTPIVGELIFKYWITEREIINKMLSSSGYWIKKPSCEGDPLLISIAGYTMFDLRREAENFIKNENFQELIK